MHSRTWACCVQYDEHSQTEYWTSESLHISNKIQLKVIKNYVDNYLKNLLELYETPKLNATFLPV